MSLFAFAFLEISAIYIILAWGIYLPFRANQAYVGAVYSMCMGAYFAGYVSRDLGWPFWLAIIGAAIFCMLFSLIFAYNLASLAGFPMMIGSTALVFISQTVIVNLPFLGGPLGFYGVPFVPQNILLATTYGIVLVVGVLIYRLDQSYIGRAMDATRFDPRVAASLGIDVIKLSMQLQIMSSILGAVAGALFAFTLGSVTISSFGFPLVTFTMALVVVGGMNTMWGIVIASPALFSISQFVPSVMKEFSYIIYAILLIVVLVIRPSGAIDRKTLRSITAFGRRLMKRHVSSS